LKSNKVCWLAALVIATALIYSLGTCADIEVKVDPTELAAAFEGAQILDLRTSKISSVALLRDEVKIPPPAEPVLVKTFKRNELPAVLEPAFKRKEVAGVTLAGRFIAIIHTDLQKEYEDVLRHELVHAYITLASPKPLPFWFQEGSAVYFSTGKTRKFYGQPSKDRVGVMVGKTVELDPVYKQKLYSFKYLVKAAGKERFYKWFREAVTSGDVDPRKLLGTSSSNNKAPSVRRPVPGWLIAAAIIIVVTVIIIGFYASRQSEEYV